MREPNIGKKLEMRIKVKERWGTKFKGGKGLESKDQE